VLNSLLILAVDTGATLLGVAAIVSAIGGIASTIMALRKSRDEEHEQCLERLRQTRSESEAIAMELHDLKVHGGQRGYAS
jgi:RNase H-fold protein (predicted Holliday junction resolvase)